MAEIFNENNIFIVEDNLEDKEQLFKLIANDAYKLGYVKSNEECFRGLLTRESQQTTGFQDGFAIPHCKDQTVQNPRLLIYKTSPIPWESLDGQAIVFSFVLLIPEESAKEHLRYLAKISKSLIDESFRQRLKAADKATIHQLVCRNLEV